MRAYTHNAPHKLCDPPIHFYEQPADLVSSDELQVFEQMLGGHLCFEVMQAAARQGPFR
jgi:hypothetical protein